MAHSREDLIRLHPLYSRLSGQVIWYLFEERELPPEQADAFLIAYERERERTLELMGRALSGEVAAVRIDVASPPALDEPCADCTRFAGALLRAGDERLPLFFPPFSLGCRASAHGVGEAELPSQHRNFLDLASPAPSRRLLCPSEWIFESPDLY